MPIFVITAIVLLSCKSQHPNFDDYKGDMIVIGKGGGFTGAYDEFAILKNGLVYKYNTLTKERLLLGNLNKNLTEQVFNNYKILKINEKNINTTGNMNFFIEFKSSENNFKCIWSDQKEENNNDLILFHKTVMNYISKTYKK